MADLAKIIKILEIDSDPKKALLQHVEQTEQRHCEMMEEMKSLQNDLKELSTVVCTKEEKETQEEGILGQIQALHDEIASLELQNGVDGKTPVKGVDYFDGKDGKSVDEQKVISEVLSKIPKPKDGEPGIDGISIKGDKGDKPKHKWEDTKLVFENPDGTWGKPVDLLGKSGNSTQIFGGGGKSVRVAKDGTLFSEQVKTINFGNGLEISGSIDEVQVSAAGSAFTDELLKISASDTTPGYLEDKLNAGAGVSLNKINTGANELLEVGFSLGAYSTSDLSEGTNLYYTEDRADTWLATKPLVSGPVSSTDNAIARFDSTTGKVIQNSTSTLDDNGNMVLANSLNFPTGAATMNFYVATTGNDSNDGLTALTPFLTLEKAFNSIPLFTAGIYQVNIADGTYQLAAVYEFPHIISKSGSSDYKSVIKIVGNTATPSNVAIKAATTSSNAFNIYSRHTLVDFDGVQIQDCSSAVTVSGYCIFRAVNVYNHYNPGPAISVSSYGLMQWAAGTGGRTITGSTNGGGGIFVQRYGLFERFCDLTITGTKNNSAVSVGSYGRWLDNTGVTSITLTADPTTKGNVGMFFTTNAVTTLRGTFNISNFSNGSGTQKAAIAMGTHAAATVVGGSVFNITNCTNGLSFLPTSAWSETSNCTHTFTTTTNPIVIQHGSAQASPNSFSGQAITYSTGSFLTHGYDARYQSSQDGGTITAANDLVLPFPKSYFVITGNTQINAISTTNRPIGSMITLRFSGSTATLKHNVAGGANTAPLNLLSSIDVAATSALILGFIYDGTFWQQTFRKGSDDNYVTDAEKTVIGNTSGVNTGDQDLSGYALTSSFASGTYTPTLTNTANIDASTAYQCQYMKVGSTVTVSGKVDVDPTLTVTTTQLGISLPVASNFGATEDCAGTAAAPAIAGQSAGIYADTTNDRAQMEWKSSDVTNQSMYFTFTYQVI